MFCLDHLNVCELGEPKFRRLSSFKLRNNLSSPFVRNFPGILKNNEVAICHVFQQKGIHCETHVLDGSARGRCYIGFDSVSQQIYVNR
jgi:hypothetical protein